MKLYRSLLYVIVFALVLSACVPAQTQATNTPKPAATTVPTLVATTPEWFDMELTDAQTGEIFTINDYAGKVVLLETMAIWCPNCVIQGNEVRKLRAALGNPDDLISVSLDVDFK